MILSTHIVVIVISFIVILAPIAVGLVYVVRGIRALINPDYYKVVSDIGDTGSDIRRVKEDMNYNPVLKRKVRGTALTNLIVGIVLLGIGIQILYKFNVAGILNDLFLDVVSHRVT